jgi:TRAP-type C4-dicarboxylate transport system permease small subunit
MSQTAPHAHAPITNEEIARTFDEEIAPVDLSGHGLEDWVTLALFWGMCLCVFVQFFTRYVLNDSYAWTEEIAVYSLVSIVFLGAAMCVRLSRHIHVDFLYRYLPPKGGRALAMFVDLVRIAVFGYLALLVWRYSSIIHDERMTTIDFPKMPLFMAVFTAFVLMTLRSAQVAWRDFRNGYSILERPGAFDGSEEEAALEAAKAAAKGA